MKPFAQKKQFKDKYRIDSLRMKNWDYGANRLYFITICTKNKNPYFAAADLVHTEIGKIANQFWSEIPNHFPYVEIDEFVIMHDHMHGILHIDKPWHIGWKPNAFGAQSKNLGSIIRAYKSSVKRYANQNNIDFEWQSRYHEKVIHSVRHLNNIRNYIRNNPKAYMEKTHGYVETHDRVKTHDCASPKKEKRRTIVRLRKTDLKK